MSAAIGAVPLEWKNGAGFRYFEVQPRGTAGKAAGFSSLTGSDSGVSFTNVVSRRLVAMNRVAENGSGVALGDVDGDGWCDIYFCGMEGDNVLYRNLGNWNFEDVTRAAGLALEKQLATGAVFADVDGDRDLDLLVNSIGGGTRLFMNDGRGKFTESPGGRLVKRFGSMSLALADVEGDGDLDLYVTNYRTIVGKDEMPRVKVEARNQNGQVVITPAGRYTSLPAKGGNVEVFELAERDFLYVNNGRGEFAPVSWTNGNFLNARGEPLKEVPLDWGLSVMMRDLNEDGLADILVCNDFFNSQDRIWLQEAGLKFRAASLQAIRKISLSSMAVDVADVNRDGLDDLFFVEMLSRDFEFRQNHRANLAKGAVNLRMSDPLHRWEIARNTMFLNMGDGSYAEVAELAGVDASEWSWGVAFLDVDLDGWEDAIISTGHNHDVQKDDVLRRLGAASMPDSYEYRMQELAQFPSLVSPMIAFRNESVAGGVRFREAQEEWGLNIVGVANGFACADLDNDGDQDLVVNRINVPALLLRNDATGGRVAVRLSGKAPNFSGVGAKIIVRGGAVVQSQRVMAGGRYLSGDDYARTFAMPEGKQAEVEVQWPDGTRSVVSGVKANTVCEISYEGAKPFTRTPNQSAPFFRDVSATLGHRNVDPSFDDYTRQPLLPYSLATPGPALAWSDLDGDGLEDLMIGGSRGGRAAIRRNTADGFAPVTNRFTTRLLVEDQMGVLVTKMGTNDPVIVQANSNYESGGKQPAAVEIGSLATIGGEGDCPGAMAMADVDSDGDLDLFVAGRVLPGRYPAAASSRVYLNGGSEFELSAEFSRAFERIGLVTSAQFTDFNDDGRADLVIACELGSVRVYVNNGREFVYESRGLEGRNGWWTSVVTGDFNNDGLTDIAAGNLGTNTKYRRFMEKTLKVFHGDVDGNGTYDVFETIFNPTLKKYVPVAGPELIIEHFPGVAERVRSYDAYAQMGIDEALGGAQVQTAEVNTMESVVCLNRGSAFEVQPLPVEAQFAPVFGMVVADFDNDGNEDLILGQNLFETRWETGRLDSGRPLWLKGQGSGSFRTMRPTESGLAADGQQRAVATADYNRDGRVDVAMSQNNGETKLFQNERGAAGARLRFEAGAQNPGGIGVRYRVVNGNAKSAMRDVQMGGGWLSQNSSVQVIPKIASNAQLQVSWPGGRKTQHELPSGAAEYFVRPEGVKVVQ
ncbi:MAG TPA: VCBS repeat-containing protein [Verrucomicrobiae bacterium]